MLLGVSAALVEGSLVPGDVRIEDGAVAEVGVVPAGGGGIAAPGFVDLHINGVAGVDFLAADAAGYRRAGGGPGAHRRRRLPTDVHLGPARRLRAGAGHGRRGPGRDRGGRAARADRRPPGGPVLSPRWPGAHDPAHLLPADPDQAGGCWAGDR